MNQEIFDFDFLHKKLQDLMKEELAILRDVLDLMKDEEIAYMKQDIPTKKNLFLKKTASNKKLKEIQKERSNLTKTLGKNFYKESKTHHFNSASFNIIIAKDEENSVETFHLRDQIIHFMKHIRQQKARLLSIKKQGDTFPSFNYLEASQPKILTKKTQKIQTLSLEPSSHQE